MFNTVSKYGVITMGIEFQIISNVWFSIVTQYFDVAVDVFLPQKWSACHLVIFSAWFFQIWISTKQNKTKKNEMEMEIKLETRKTRFVSALNLEMKKKNQIKSFCFKNF